MNLVTNINYLINSFLTQGFILSTPYLSSSIKRGRVNPLTVIVSTFSKIRFLSFFYFEKLNKRLYKYARYKRPRFSIKYFFVQPYKRFRILLKFLQKSFIFETGQGYKSRVFPIMLRLLLSRKSSFVLKFLN